MPRLQMRAEQVLVTCPRCDHDTLAVGFEFVAAERRTHDYPGVPAHFELTIGACSMCRTDDFGAAEERAIRDHVLAELSDITDGAR